jgi:hypothetical protein
MRITRVKKSKVTEYEQYSVFSGTPTSTRHHLLFGRGIRNLAEQDGIWIPVTDAEHNMSSKGTINQIHGNPAAEKLSKIAGQLAWERAWIISQAALPFESEDEAYDRLSRECREAFRKRYGQSFL